VVEVEVGVELVGENGRLTLISNNHLLNSRCSISTRCSNLSLFPPRAYGFMPGGMPPPSWGFGGPYPPYPPPQFGVQSNQWIAANQGGNQGQGQSSGERAPKNKGQNSKNVYKKKLVSTKEPETNLVPLSSLNYAGTVFLCCGEPGHGKSTCSKQKFCFICKASNHVDDECPVLKRPHQIGRYVGSAAIGLGFYHIEAPESSINPISSKKTVE
jgi:hypothetical protein